MCERKTARVCVCVRERERELEREREREREPFIRSSKGTTITFAVSECLSE